MTNFRMISDVLEKLEDGVKEIRSAQEDLEKTLIELKKRIDIIEYKDKYR